MEQAVFKQFSRLDSWPSATRSSPLTVSYSQVRWPTTPYSSLAACMKVLPVLTSTRLGYSSRKLLISGSPSHDSFTERLLILLCTILHILLPCGQRDYWVIIAGEGHSAAGWGIISNLRHRWVCRAATVGPKFVHSGNGRPLIELCHLLLVLVSMSLQIVNLSFSL